MRLKQGLKALLRHLTVRYQERTGQNEEPGGPHPREGRRCPEGRPGIGSQLLGHIGVKKAVWLKTMTKWTATPESAIEKAINGVDDMVGGKTLEDLESWRNARLISLYNLLRDQKD